MATVTPNSSLAADRSIVIADQAKDSRRAPLQAGPTNHLKIVPESKSLRERMRARSAELVAKLDKSRSLGKDEIELLARQILIEFQLPEGHVGWTMVVLASEFWREQVENVPCNRRLLLLPAVLQHIGNCGPAVDFATHDTECAPCAVSSWQSAAQTLGYQVLSAEDSATVTGLIFSGEVDAIVGVASLDVLEKAIDKILSAGIPCMAVPLLTMGPLPATDRNHVTVDRDWVDEMIAASRHAANRNPANGVAANGNHSNDSAKLPINSHAPPQTLGYVHLLRAATNLFKREELERIVPRLRGGPSLAEANGQGIAGIDPIAGTEVIAYDFLSRGGKHSRPFITLAVYDAMTGGKATLHDGAEHLAKLPSAIKRVAMSIETFHKASLVHDDIEDDDAFRYGEPTLHRKYGTPTAINVGDYLIGLGYRLVSRESKTLGADVVADILDRLADAHLKLSEGQGAELLWRDARHKRLSSADALQIYALKTSPAFEAALFSGLRLAGPIEQFHEPVSQFARYLGVAFQILNDLGDWRGDNHNKLLAAGDVLGGRPTVLWALALEGLDDRRRALLQSIVSEQSPSPQMVSEVRQLYTEAGVFEQAAALIEKYRGRAEAVADQLQPVELSRLFRYLIETVLDGAK